MFGLKKTIWKYFLFICKKGWFIVLSKKKKKFREVDRSSWAMVTKAQLLNIHNQKTYNQHIITTSTLISKERSQKKMAPLDNNFLTPKSDFESLTVELVIFNVIFVLICILYSPSINQLEIMHQLEILLFFNQIFREHHNLPLLIVSILSIVFYRHVTKYSVTTNCPL